MIEAARITRNELQALPIGDGHAEALEGRRISTRAIARAIWRQDVHLAHKLIHSTAMGRLHLTIDGDNRVLLVNPPAFERECMDLHLAWHEHQQAAAAARLREHAQLQLDAGDPTIQ
eukprot:9486519-Pyramimonas_sp.AAC.1